MILNCLQPHCESLRFLPPCRNLNSSSPFQNRQEIPYRVVTTRDFTFFRERSHGKNRGRFVQSGLLPVDPWAPNIDSQSIASQLFAASLFPYLGFLYFITKSKSAPKLTLFGFYFLLAFVGATIPAGIYAKVHYGTSLANVDWLHGGAEFLLTLTNLFIVLGLRQALRKPRDTDQSKSSVLPLDNEQKKPSL